MVMAGTYTDKERREILKAAAEYDRRIDDELHARETRPTDPIDELYRTLEEDTLEAIRFYSGDIGLLLAIREQFRDRYEIREMVRHMVNLERHEIETLREDMERERETAAELYLRDLGKNWSGTHSPGRIHHSTQLDRATEWVFWGL